MIDRIEAFHDDTLGTINGERLKYERIWAVPEYAKHSPGKEICELFEEMCSPSGSVIDLGSGSGKGAIALDQLGLRVTMLDLTFKGLVPEAEFRKIEASLWGDWSGPYDWGYCTDVMEHIPIEYTMLVLDRIMSNCRSVFFHICLVPDGFGKVIGQPLHLTVMPFEWWRDKLGEFGKVVECRDLMANGVYHVAR